MKSGSVVFFPQPAMFQETNLRQAAGFKKVCESAGSQQGRLELDEQERESIWVG